jgi:hypothetical protein
MVMVPMGTGQEQQQQQQHHHVPEMPTLPVISAPAARHERLHTSKRTRSQFLALCCAWSCLAVATLLLHPLLAQTDLASINSQLQAAVRLAITLIGAAACRCASWVFPFPE